MQFHKMKHTKNNITGQKKWNKWWNVHWLSNITFKISYGVFNAWSKENVLRSVLLAKTVRILDSPLSVRNVQLYMERCLKFGREQCGSRARCVPVTFFSLNYFLNFPYLCTYRRCYNKSSMDARWAKNHAASLFYVKLTLEQIIRIAKTRNLLKT